MKTWTLILFLLLASSFARAESISVVVDIQVTGVDPQDLYAYSPVRFISIDPESEPEESEEVTCSAGDHGGCQLDSESRFHGQLSVPHSALRIEISHPEAEKLIPTKQMLSAADNGSVVRKYEPLQTAQGLLPEVGKKIYGALEQHAAATGDNLSLVVSSAVTRSNYIQVPLSARIDLAKYSLEVDPNLYEQDAMQLMKQFADASTLSVVSFEDLSAELARGDDLPVRISAVKSAVEAGDFGSVVAGELVARDAVASSETGLYGPEWTSKLPHWGMKFVGDEENFYEIFNAVAATTDPKAQLERDFPWHAVEDAIERGCSQAQVGNYECNL